MTNGQGQGNGRTAVYAAVGAALVAAVGVALWATSDLSGPPAAEGVREQTASPESGAPAEPAAPATTTPAPAVRAPAVSIDDRGRLSVGIAALREGSVLALGLSMPDEVRGEGAHAVRIVDVAGRALDLQAQPIDGAGAGLRLEIDPEWLRPGRYMINVETHEKRPLAVRRYVLEITDPPASGS